VLVPVDFSPPSLWALSRAARLPLAPGARLELLHVLPPAFPAPLDAEAEALALARMAEAADVRRRLLPGAGAVAVASEVVRGDAPRAILEQADRTAAELIVLGRSGLLTRGARTVGATARAVARRARRPVLLVGSGGGRPYRRPLVALGLEEESREALRLAARLAGTPGRVRAAHASTAGAGPTHRAALALGIAPQARSLVSVRQELARHLRSLGEVPARVRVTIARGSPRDVVLGVARARRADLIALGAHGRRSALQRLLHGSVAEELLREAHCDVLIARPA
jgi:nucleotide-binding universal stress UspA family protein